MTYALANAEVQARKAFSNVKVSVFTVSPPSINVLSKALCQAAVIDPAETFS